MVLLVAGSAALALSVPAVLHQRGVHAVVRLALVAPLEAQQNGELLLGLRDDGPARVRILRARLDGDGYGWQSVDAGLDPRQATDVHLPVTPRCPPAQPSVLLVDVLAGGRREHVRLALNGDGGQQLLAAAQRFCGSYSLPQSLQVSAVGATGSSAAEAVLQLDLENQATQPLTLLGVDAGRGFRVELDRPVPLVLRGHPAPYDVGADPTRVVVRVRVVDCRLLRGRGRQPDAPADGQLLFTLGRGGETAVSAFGSAPYGEPQLQALARTCG